MEEMNLETLGAVTHTHTHTHTQVTLVEINRNALRELGKFSLKYKNKRIATL